MAKLIIANKNRASARFIAPSLSRYSIDAYVYRQMGNTFINFSLPVISFRHHDVRTVLDVADGLRKIVSWGCKQKDTGNPKFIANTEKPVFSPLLDSVRMQIFRYKETPYIDVHLEEDDFFRWTILGFFFNDDFPSAVKYIASLERMPDYVRQLL